MVVDHVMFGKEERKRKRSHYTWNQLAYPSHSELFSMFSMRVLFSVSVTSVSVTHSLLLLFFLSVSVTHSLLLLFSVSVSVTRSLLLLFSVSVSVTRSLLWTVAGCGARESLLKQ